MANKSYYNKDHKKFARSLRQTQTNAESLLWSKLRNRQLEGYKFKRQFPVDRYIIDFYCHDKKLGIELDGGQHSLPKNIIYDSKRTFLLAQKGIILIRFWDNDIFNNVNGVLEIILKHLKSFRPHPALSYKEKGKRELL